MMEYYGNNDWRDYKTLQHGGSNNVEYYGNNDWRDYQYLKHYGVKGMKWRKRKNNWGTGTISVNKDKNGSDVFIRTENYNKNWAAKGGYQNGYMGNKVGVRHDKKKRTISVYNTFGKRYEKKYWNNPNKYNKRTKKGKYGSKSWAEDGASYTFNYGASSDAVKRKVNRAKTKVTNFLRKRSRKKRR